MMKRVGLHYVAGAAAIAAWASVITNAYGANNTPVPRDLGGVKLGAKSETLFAKCKASRWQCTKKKKRKVRGHDIERITVDLPSGEFRRMHVVAGNGVIVSARAWYRTTRASRADDLAKTHGIAAADWRGSAVWLSDNFSTRMRVSRSGKSVDLLALDDAQKTGLLSAPQAMRAMQAFPKPSKGTLITGLTLDTPSQLIVHQGDSPAIGLQVANVLKAKSPAATLQYKLYAGISESPIDTQSLPVMALAANGSTRLTINLGNNLAVGFYRAEISLSGLKKVVPILLLPSGPDLRIAEVQAPTSATPGEELTLKARVHNLGLKASSQPWTVTFLLNNVPVTVTSAKKIEIGQASDLGKSEWVSVKAKFEPSYVGQNAELKVVVGSPEDININNNQAGKTILSKAAPMAAAALEKIPVTIRINSLKNIDSYDDELWWWTDDPALYISGFHSRDAHTWNDQIWTHDKLDEGDNAVAVNRVIFPNGDPRRSVTRGETVGFHVSLWDRDDLGDDDTAKYQDTDPGWQLDWNEIDYVDLIFDFEFLKAHQNSTFKATQVLDLPQHYLWSADGTKYELDYSLEVGSPTSVTPVANSANLAEWAGSYEWTLDGHKGTATLKANAGTATFPHGFLSGSWKDGPTSTAVVTQAFAGNRWVFSVGKGSYTGFLIGGADPKSRSIAGTAVTDGNEYGFFMRLP